MNSATDLPAILAGPILRHSSPEQITLWLVSSCALNWRPEILSDEGQTLPCSLDPTSHSPLQLGEHCFVYLLQIKPDTPLPTDRFLSYRLDYQLQGRWVPFSEWASEVLYPGENAVQFRIASKLTNLLHGSCRKPHHPSRDGLTRADAWVETHHSSPERWPDLLMLSGDQLYADDVAGPFLVACHQLAQRLKLWDEILPGTEIASLSTLIADERCYYRRSELLPDTRVGVQVKKRFFEGKRKPIFTTDSAQNHLITASEVFAAYLLTWGAACWRLVNPTVPTGISAAHRQTFERELEALTHFQNGLPQAARVLAHLPTYMIWDDHDVTDDWNLSAAWEQAAYSHPLSRRIIGNAMLGYLIFQHLGNQPGPMLDEFGPALHAWCQKPTEDQQGALIETLLKRGPWSYEIALDPGLIVLDTRTQRWRSERDPEQPSGLMDWESLVELQQQLLDRKVVVLVSPAPIFGVKLIEAIQRLFTWLGKPLMVDAENWMAHPGSANVMLNIFRHSRTPEQFIILSGDVHYSFVYDIEIRFRQGGPKIHQITSSGIKNQFPERLLAILDRLNRWLYASGSPLNWFTKRRLMRVRPRKPTPSEPGRRLVNQSGIGWVQFGTDGAPVEIRQLSSEGPDTRFLPSDEEEHWS